MKAKLENIKSEAIAALNAAESLKETDELRVKYLGKKGEFISRIEGKLWEHKGTPEDEEVLRMGSVVTSVAYVDGAPCVRYVSDAPFLLGSTAITATLEDAYIYALGGVKR